MRDNRDTVDSRYLFFRTLIDVILVIALLISIALFEFVLVLPAQRGFFCSDETLHYPVRPDVVSAKTLVSIVLLIAMSILFVVELKIHRSQSRSQRNPSRFSSKVPSFISDFLEHFMFFLFGLLLTVNATEVGKFTIGRLRPHFMDLCQPQMLDGSTCKSPENHLRYVEQYMCTAEGFTVFDLISVRGSFPSIHSSVAFYALVYMSIYVQHKMTWKGSKLFRHVLQFILISLAWFLALLGLKTYTHHWSDVVCGSLLGVVIAVLTARYVTGDFGTHRVGSRTDFHGRDTSASLNECGAEVAEKHLNEENMN
ncbi:putative phosphatidate phosphatase [Ceratitis capitata]|uniref:putative phosphatidate phosphatase n=1 Tax=Ceratitis capitata TaxID=7213 RepID=UPI000329E488|nr:putative phosphatidate phosphatase [Ceratitis capitata]